jgi:cell division septation protein DedD
VYKRQENTETKSDKPDIEGFKLPEFQPAPAADKEEEKKKKFAWYWFLLLLIPIFIGVYFVIFNQSQSNKSNETATAIPEKIEQAEEKPELISEDTAKKDTLAIELPPVLETKATEEPNTVFKGVSGKYYLIRGGFEDEENVKEYMRELQAEGVESFVVGKTGRLILVGIEEFSTEDDAMKALNQYFKTKPDWKLWVYKVK